MATSKPELPIVHIHSPRFPRDPVEVFGNKRGLERVINALIEAVSVGVGGGEVYASDGTGSQIRAACVPISRRSEDWTRSGSPYWDISDPYVARIVQLTEENGKLKEAIQTLRQEREPLVDVQPGPSVLRDGEEASARS